MCGIIGFFNFKNNYKKTIEGLKLIKHRGVNACGIYYNEQIIFEQNPQKLQNKIYKLETNNKNYKNIINKEFEKNLERTEQNKEQFVFGHVLHSITSFTPQPIKGKGILVVNCEIYNWKELCSKLNLKSQNDSQLLLQLLDKIPIEDFKKQIKNLDGPFAFAYKRENKIILCRDLLGIKPLFYYFDCSKKHFAFASERKAFKIDISKIKEVDPKQILIYDTKTNRIQFVQKYFFKLKQPNQNQIKPKSFEQIKQKTKSLLIESIKKRIPEDSKIKIGILFSGGVDSTFIALVLKQLNIRFTCYTLNLLGGNMSESEDLKYSKQIAKQYNLKLKIINIKIDQLPKYIKQVIKLIEEKDYIKTSIALPFYLSSKKAKKDKIKIIFSGLGAEEIFAGYKRHKQTDDINKECLDGLKVMHKRDLYRDDVVTMKNNLEVRIPFLDNNLIKYSININPIYKINRQKTQSKLILRQIAQEMGLDEEYAFRKKRAAQYGSNIDKAISKLAKKKGQKKQEYLDNL